MTSSAVRKHRNTLFWVGITLAVGINAVPAATVEVTVDNFVFTPSSVTIKPGDTVRWNWIAGNHTITSGDNCTSDGRFSFGATGPSPNEFQFSSAGTFSYFCVPHCRAGMVGQVVVSEAPKKAVKLDNPIPGSIGRGDVSVKLQRVAKGLRAPIFATVAPGDSNRLFVVDQIGTITAINLVNGQNARFADLRSLLVPLGLFNIGYDERGLLGLAFHPDYQSNGLLYTYTSEPVSGTADFSTITSGKTADHQNVVREWHVNNPSDTASVVDPASTRVVLRSDHPQFNHDGGTLSFHDGLLYISMGDGGNADDQGDAKGGGHVKGGNGQSLATVLGKVLRIDPRGNTSQNGQYSIPADNPFVPAQGVASGGSNGCSDGNCDEIYAYGFRNPYRFSFDLERGDLYLADVGQNNIEEVDVVQKGGNYGWRKKEGRFCFNANGQGEGFVTAPANCSNVAAINPVAQYDHDEGIAIVGGYVYRGATLSALRGRYVFGDYARNFGAADGRLFYLKRPEIVAGALTNSGIAELKIKGRKQLGLAVLGIAEDAQGELYVLGNKTGVLKGKTGGVWRLGN